MNKKGMTLVEVLIAISLFTLAAVISTNILVNVVKLEKKTSVENAIYEDVRVIMQQLSQEIAGGTIDYDEYFNVCVIQNSCDSTAVGYSPNATYGINHGVYGSRFYDPGKRSVGGLAKNPDDLGIECSFPDPLNGKECEITYALSGDLNTGQNPFKGSGSADSASAFCEEKRGICSGGNSVVVDQLFLIDETGTEKTILARKAINTKNADFALGKVVLNGEDSDQNGLMDTFKCSDEYNCVNPQKSDLSVDFQAKVTEFFPITPLRSNIKDLKFVIGPVEDPYKGYAESDMRFHPSVTVILTLDLSAEFEEMYPGDFEPFTVQLTVAAGLTDRIESYPPINDIYEKNDVSWIEKILPAALDRSK